MCGAAGVNGKVVVLWGSVGDDNNCGSSVGGGMCNSGVICDVVEVVEGLFNGWCRGVYTVVVADAYQL